VAVTPAAAVADVGAPIDVAYRWTRVAGAPAPSGDLWVFVHFMDASGMLLWTDDHRPPVPPSQWGSDAVAYRRTVFVPRLPYSGEVRLRVGLYAPATGDRVPLAGAETRDGAVAAGSIEVRPPTNAVFVAFGAGWHGAERAPQEPLREWRWSGGAAHLSFRATPRDSVMWIELDQPVAQVGTQRLQVRAASELLATLPITPGARVVHQVPLPVQRVHSAMVDLTLTVSPTFVPSAIPALGSQDTRELGARVFNVYVAPK
jgi:hypothetical protein